MGQEQNTSKEWQGIQRASWSARFCGCSYCQAGPHESPSKEAESDPDGAIVGGRIVERFPSYLCHP
jgi:hypothetical protein